MRTCTSVAATATMILMAMAGSAAAQSIGQKLNGYITCTNRISGRAYDAQERYLSWVGKSGPTGKEKLVYGTYTISGAADCAKSVNASNAMEPRATTLETAASDYVAPYPHLVAFHKRIGARPAVVAAMKAEGLIK